MSRLEPFASVGVEGSWRGGGGICSFFSLEAVWLGTQPYAADLSFYELNLIPGGGGRKLSGGGGGGWVGRGNKGRKTASEGLFSAAKAEDFAARVSRTCRFQRPPQTSPTTSGWPGLPSPFSPSRMVAAPFLGHRLQSSTAVFFQEWQSLYDLSTDGSQRSSFTEPPCLPMSCVRWGDVTHNSSFFAAAKSKRDLRIKNKAIPHWGHSAQTRT